MPHKKKGKQKSPSVPQANQATPLVKQYQFKDLDGSLVSKLIVEHPASFQQLVTEIEASANLSMLLQKKISAMIAEFKETLQLVYTDEKLKNLHEEFNNTAYFISSYRFKLSVLYLKLNDRNNAKEHLHCALLQSEHPIIIKNYILMISAGLIGNEADVAIQMTYLWHIIKYSNAVRLTSKTKADLEQHYQFFQLGNTTQVLEVFSNTVFAYYLENHKYQEIEQLLDVISKASLSLKTCAATLLELLINHYLELDNFEEIDRTFLQYEKLVTSEHCSIVTRHLKNKIHLGQLYQDRLKQYLEKNVALRDLNSQVTLAMMLIMDPNRNISQCSRGLLLIKDIQKSLKSKKGVNFDQERGICLYLTGVIYHRDLLPKDPRYKQNILLAKEHFLKAIQYNNKLACVDLAVIYRDGEGVPQNLDQAIIYLQQAIHLNNPLAAIELASIQLMQTAKLANQEEKNKLLLTAIETMNQVGSCDHLMDKTERARKHFLSALLYLFKDFNLDFGLDRATESVTRGVSVLPLSYHPVNETTHASTVHTHLLHAISDYIFARAFLGTLLHYGTYLSQDLDFAEQQYKICLAEGFEMKVIGTALLELYLLKIKQAVTTEERQAYLFKALHWNSVLLKNADGDFKALLTQSFSKLITCYRNHDYSSEELSSIRAAYKQHRFSSEIQFFSEKKAIGPQLNRAIEAALPQLEATSQNEGSIIELLKSMYDVSLILKKSKSEVPSYMSELYHLPRLETPIPLFIQLPINAQIALINNYSTWPLIANPEGFIPKLLAFIQSKDMGATERVSLILAMTHFKHEAGLLEAELIRLFFDEATHISINNMVTAAQLLYILAICHANGSDKLISGYITPIMTQYYDFVIHYLQEHCWQADAKSMSQIYHAINYLRFAYPSLFTAMPETLEKFMQCHEKILASDTAVTISRQQQNVYDMLSHLSPGFIHEAFVGGRRVDFYNPQTKEAVFFHGPSHYLYQEGRMLENTATVLNRKTLENQGISVISIPYFQWNEASIQNKPNLLKQLIPSLRPLLEKEGQEVTVARLHYSTIKPGQSSPAFWQAFDLQRLSDSVTETKTYST